MFAYFRTSSLWLILASSGVLSAQEMVAKPAYKTDRDRPAANKNVAILGNPSDEKQALPDLTLTGAEVIAEALSRLADHHWGTITLADAHFSGEIIESLRRAASIRALRLFGTGLSGQIPRLEHVIGLRALEIGTPLTGPDLEAIGQLTQLEQLILPQELTVNVSGGREIARLINLRSLRLYNVNIDDASFVELQSLVHLEELDLTHTKITDAGLSTIQKMPRLRTLELDRHSAWKQQLTDACLPSIQRLSELERLSLSGKITNMGLVQIKLPKLRSLSILNTQITGKGLAALEHSRVEDLTLSGNQINSALGESPR